MPSRLSSLLVRDGLVGVKRMEKAFQRQVIYGGSLDTILLEMNLVPEERLTQYLALASGLPPAKRDEADRIEAEALATLSPEVAQQFRAVPLGFDGEALRVLVCSPLEINELEDLADLLDRPLQPLITPEYRWHLAFAKVYEAELRPEATGAQVEDDASCCSSVYETASPASGSVEPSQLRVKSPSARGDVPAATLGTPGADGGLFAGVGLLTFTVNVAVSIS